jgi:hypothetical protein
MIKMKLDGPVALFNLHAKERLHEASSSDVEVPQVLLHDLVLELVVGGNVNHVIHKQSMDNEVYSRAS